MNESRSGLRRLFHTNPADVVVSHACCAQRRVTRYPPRGRVDHLVAVRAVAVQGGVGQVGQHRVDRDGDGSRPQRQQVGMEHLPGVHRVISQVVDTVSPSAQARSAPA